MSVEAGIQLYSENDQKLMDRDNALFTLAFATATHPKSPNQPARVTQMDFGPGLYEWNKMTSRIAVDHGPNLDALKCVHAPIDGIQVPRMISMRTVYGGDNLGYATGFDAEPTQGTTLLQVFEYNEEGEPKLGTIDYRGRLLETYALPRIRGKHNCADYPEFKYGWYPASTDQEHPMLNDVRLYQVMKDLFGQMYPHTEAPGHVANR